MADSGSVLTSNSSSEITASGFGFGQWVSLFWLDLNFCVSLAAVEIVNAEFVVVADTVGEGAFELRVEG